MHNQPRMSKHRVAYVVIVVGLAHHDISFLFALGCDLGRDGDHGALCVAEAAGAEAAVVILAARLPNHPRAVSTPRVIGSEMTSRW